MPGNPHRGSKVSKTPYRKIGKAGENRGKIVARRDLQPTAAFPILSTSGLREFFPTQKIHPACARTRGMLLLFALWAMLRSVHFRTRFVPFLYRRPGRLAFLALLAS
jgi:hypothetical protein